MLEKTMRASLDNYTCTPKSFHQIMTYYIPAPSFICLQQDFDLDNNSSFQQVYPGYYSPARVCVEDVIVTLSEIGGRCERGGPGQATANACYNQGYHSPDIYANRKCLRRPFQARCKHLHVGHFYSIYTTINYAA